MKNPRLNLCMPLVFLLILSITLVYASVFVYHPASAYLQPVEPPLVFRAVPTRGVSSSIGPNSTSAQVSITIPIAQVQLLQNPNFTGTLDPWSYSGSGSWTASQNAEATDGWAAYWSATVPRWSSVYSLLYQSVYVPAQQINISARFITPDAGRDVPYTVTFGLYDPASGMWVEGCYKSIPGVTWRDWTEDYVVCTPPRDGEYLALFNVSADNGTGATKTARMYLDYFSIVVVGGYAGFSGAVLEVYNQDYQPYYAVLILDAEASTYGNITSCNITLGESTPIWIQNGRVVSDATSEVRVDPQSAAPVYVNASVTGGTSTLYLTLKYCTLSGGDGACVFYPLVINLAAG